MTVKKLRVKLSVAGSAVRIKFSREVTPAQQAVARFITALEYPESAFIRNDLEDYDTLQMFMQQLYQYAFQSLTREASCRGGFDHNVYLATYVALCSTAWLSWVTSAKAKDGARDGEERAQYAEAHDELLEILKQAIEMGEVMGNPILKERKKRPDRRGEVRPRYFGRGAYYGALEEEPKRS